MTPLSVLTLRAVPRDAPPSPGQQDRARYLPRLRVPLLQLEPVVDGAPLRQVLLDLPGRPVDVFGHDDTFDLLSVADPAWPEDAAASLRQLAGVEPRDESQWPLAPGRLPLFVCSACADLGCGAVTVQVDDAEGTVVWRDLRSEAGPDDVDRVALTGLGPFRFDRDAYRAALLAPVADLERTAAEDAEARRRWRREHGPQGAVRRLLSR